MKGVLTEIGFLIINGLLSYFITKFLIKNIQKSKVIFSIVIFILFVLAFSFIEIYIWFNYFFVISR
jgi:hypothetical protein